MTKHCIERRTSANTRLEKMHVIVMWKQICGGSGERHRHGPCRLLLAAREPSCHAGKHTAVNNGQRQLLYYLVHGCLLATAALLVTHAVAKTATQHATASKPNNMAAASGACRATMPPRPVTYARARSQWPARVTRSQMPLSLWGQQPAQSAQHWVGPRCNRNCNNMQGTLVPRRSFHATFVRQQQAEDTEPQGAKL